MGDMTSRLADHTSHLTALLYVSSITDYTSVIRDHGHFPHTETPPGCFPKWGLGGGERTWVAYLLSANRLTETGWSVLRTTGLVCRCYSAVIYLILADVEP
jgi:hypothetical protein